MRFRMAAMILVASAGVSLASPLVAQAHDDYSYRSDRVLEGGRYRTMRALAHYLDERTQHALDQAAESAHHGDRSEQRFLGSIQHFSRQASQFHEQMDRYAESPWDVGDDIEHLTRDARRVSDRIRAAHVFEHTWDDWDAVLDVLDRMERVQAGEHVQVPNAHRRGWRDYDRDYEGYEDTRRPSDDTRD